MGHISYIFKLLIFTVIVMIIMQAHVSRKTLENHAEDFIRKSSITEPAREIAHAGFYAFKHFYHSGLNAADGFVEKEFRAENSPGRKKIAEIKRSLGYTKQQIRKNGEDADEDSIDAANDTDAE